MNLYHFQSFSIFLFFCCQTIIFASPVLIWSNVELPKISVPLSGLKPEDLIIQQICRLTNPNFEVRLFAVESLQIEDLDEPHAFLSYSQTENSKARYFPEVSLDPYTAFSSLATWTNSKCSHVKFTVIHKNTYEYLEHALNAIQANIDKIEADSKQDVLIVLLRAHSNRERSPRHRRAANNSVKEIIISDNKTCMFYAETLIWHTVNEGSDLIRTYNLELQSSKCMTNDGNGTVGSPKNATVELLWRSNNNTTPSTVNFNMTASIRGSSWYLTEITMNNMTYRYFAFGSHDTMKTPWYFSYVCNRAVFVQYNNTQPYGVYNFSNMFYLTTVQFQPFAGNGIQFGQANYCTSFFTGGIWMGITSSLLLLGILLFGVHRMMTIKANDRFDDPKGKPLLIKAQE